MNAPALTRLSAAALRPVHTRALSVFLVAGEPSGDALGADLMGALKQRAGDARFAGVGGPAMEAQGLTSLLALRDISVMGVLPVLRRLPNLLAAIRKVADAAIAARPDVLVIIDSPDFTHRVAKRVRRALPDLPIIDYVSPSVWAWRPRRAKRMRAYIDHVLALLPFEPAAYRRLGGPDCSYVGHPLVEQAAAMVGNAEGANTASRSTLLVMPGSRESEIRRLMPVFGEAVALITKGNASPSDLPPPHTPRDKGEGSGMIEIVLPTLPHLEDIVRSQVQRWPVQPRIVTEASDKQAAMRRARAALVASGTATLELALLNLPMVVAYRVSLIEELVARLMLKIDTIALPNLILGRKALPEFLQRDCTGEGLARVLQPLLADGTQRDAQLAAFGELQSLMNVPGRQSPSDKAARIIEEIVRERDATRYQPSVLVDGDLLPATNV
jgi:lipid-A-disaccharide synthase